MYAFDAACRALAPASRSAAPGTAPAESGIAVAIRAPVRHMVCNLMSLLTSIFKTSGLPLH